MRWPISALVSHHPWIHPETMYYHPNLCIRQYSVVRKDRARESIWRARTKQLQNPSKVRKVFTTRQKGCEAATLHLAPNSVAFCNLYKYICQYGQIYICEFWQIYWNILKYLYNDAERVRSSRASNFTLHQIVFFFLLEYETKTTTNCIEKF